MKKRGQLFGMLEVSVFRKVLTIKVTTGDSKRCNTASNCKALKNSS